MEDYIKELYNSIFTNNTDFDEAEKNALRLVSSPYLMNIHWVMNFEDGLKKYNQIITNDYKKCSLVITDFSSQINPLLILRNVPLQNMEYNVNFYVDRKIKNKIYTGFRKSFNTNNNKNITKYVLANTRYCITDMFKDSSELGAFSFFEKEKMVKYSHEDSRLLNIFLNIIKSCAGLYIIGDKDMILVEKPKSIINGIVDIEF